MLSHLGECLIELTDDEMIKPRKKERKLRKKKKKSSTRCSSPCIIRDLAPCPDRLFRWTESDTG